MSMRWSNVIGLALFAYLASMNVLAQQPAAGAQPADNGDHTTDSLNIVDDGGSLKVAPGAPAQVQPGQPQQAAPQEEGDLPGQQVPDSTNLGPDGSPLPNGMGMPAAPDNQNMGPPPGEMEMPSAPNESMVPETPSQESIPAPAQGSMQN